MLNRGFYSSQGATPHIFFFVYGLPIAFLPKTRTWLTVMLPHLKPLPSAWYCRATDTQITAALGSFCKGLVGSIRRLRPPWWQQRGRDQVGWPHRRLNLAKGPVYSLAQGLPAPREAEGDGRWHWDMAAAPPRRGPASPRRPPWRPGRATPFPSRPAAADPLISRDAPGRGGTRPSRDAPRSLVTAPLLRAVWVAVMAAALRFGALFLLLPPLQAAEPSVEPAPEPAASAAGPAAPPETHAPARARTRSGPAPVTDGGCPVGWGLRGIGGSSWVKGSSTHGLSQASCCR